MCGDPVGLVSELRSAANAMHERAPEGVVELVLVRCVCDLSAVFKNDGLASFDV